VLVHEAQQLRLQLLGARREVEVHGECSSLTSS
jgi:hypothetical protein